MRRGLVHALAWSLATGAAVTLSWWGVHTVLSGTVYDPPRALPVPLWAADGTHGPDGRPLTSSTRYPGPDGPSASTAPETGPGGGPTPSVTPSDTPSGTPSRRPSPTAESPAAPPPKTGSGGGSGPESGSGTNVKSYAVDGGRVAFDLGGTSAELVSATPAPGWQMQVWKQTTWIRVTFTRDGRELSVFCVWHDTAPRVEIEDRAV
ncbi:hypothetical protein ACFY5H_00475 [Streptomyces sp. NPDC013012]|uniref:hypothetical protein n=1 Tax=Streptomyces sp. NPDC013012 TaxID=3364860 RepID=UPI00368117EE